MFCATRPPAAGASAQGVPQPRHNLNPPRCEVRRNRGRARVGAWLRTRVLRHRRHGLGATYQRRAHRSKRQPGHRGRFREGSLRSVAGHDHASRLHRPPAPRTARSPWSLGGPSPAARLPLVGRPGRCARRPRAAGRAGAIGRRLGGRRLGVRSRAGVDRPPLRRPWQLCAGRGRKLAPLHRRRPALPARRRAQRTGVGPRGGRRRCAPAAPWRLHLSGRARGRGAGRGRRRHGRDGPRGGPRARPARGPRPGRRRAGSHRLAGALVAVQRREQGRDAALRGHVLAAHARRAPRRVRLASRPPASRCCSRSRGSWQRPARCGSARG